MIWAYVNGDKHHKGTKFVIHHKKFKTMEQLKLLMSNKMVLPTGPVLKVLHYDPALPRLVEEVKSLDDFIDNHHYVVCGAEKFNRTASTCLVLVGSQLSQPLPYQSRLRHYAGWL